MSYDRPETVLIVDDDTVLRDALREALAAEGFRVGCVENGRQAIDILRAGARPSVILLDLHTPEMEGPLLAARSAPTRRSPTSLSSSSREISNRRARRAASESPFT